MRRRRHSYVSNRRALLMAGEAIEKQYDRDLKEKLCACIRKVRNYLAASRNGAFAYLESYPCGHQDAFGDKVEAMFCEFRTLMAAYELGVIGRATRLHEILDSALERED